MLERRDSSDLKPKGGPEFTRIVGEEWTQLTEYEKEVHITISLQRASPNSDHLYSHTRRSRPKTACDTSVSTRKCTASLPLPLLTRKRRTRNKGGFSCSATVGVLMGWVGKGLGLDSCRACVSNALSLSIPYFLCQCIVVCLSATCIFNLSDQPHFISVVPHGLSLRSQPFCHSGHDQIEDTSQTFEGATAPPQRRNPPHWWVSVPRITSGGESLVCCACSSLSPSMQKVLRV